MKNLNWKKCVLRADSRDVIKRIPDSSIDLILTDPPYNISKHSTGNIPLPGRAPMNNDVAEWDLIEFNPEEWADEFVRILKPNGNLFIFTSYNQIGRWYNSLDHRFDTSNFMIWHKTNPAPKIFKAGFLNSCEIIFTCWNKKHTWNFISQSEMHNFVESPICMRPERLSSPKHPTQKPVSILKKMIEIASNAGDIVFDPFMGVGSTGIAAIELDRRFIGVEINEAYYQAAKERIENRINNNVKNNGMYNSDNLNSSSMVSEEWTSYLSSNLEIDSIFKSNEERETDKQSEKSTILPPIIKWPGGKEKELKYILPNLPRFNRYYEPFVGGGSVFMSIEAKECYINDFSSELIELYSNISTTNQDFFHYAMAIELAWKRSLAFFKANMSLVDLYMEYRNGIFSKDSLKDRIDSFCFEKQEDIYIIIGEVFNTHIHILLEEMRTNLLRKMVRMHKLEIEKHQLPIKDVNDNIETAIKSALYMYFRHLYNDRIITEKKPKMHCALFFFIRNYAYSGMFRYSGKGDFNVPYGGIAYNSKSMAKKLEYYQSEAFQHHFINTRIYNLDFEEFLRLTQPMEDDFIFLDPPYDSEFNTYARHVFSQDDQKRLADYLINECKAKWMMIIKNTDYIFGLYNRDGINIRMFDKEYVVSFMNRNEKKVTHLLITNYKS